MEELIEYLRTKAGVASHTNGWAVLPCDTLHSLASMLEHLNAQNEELLRLLAEALRKG